jgi:hypothetical protein
MKNTLIIMILIGGFIAAAQGVSHGANLIKNGDFEEIGKNMAPSGWVISPGRNTQSVFSLDKADKKTGSHSLKITVQNPPGQVTLLPAKGSVGPPVPRKTYELSMWIKTENLVMNQQQVTPAARMNFRPTQARPYPMIDLRIDVSENSGWQHLSMQMQAPSDAREFIIDFLLTPGTVWLDDITLREVD